MTNETRTSADSFAEMMDTLVGADRNEQRDDREDEIKDAESREEKEDK